MSAYNLRAEGMKWGEIGVALKLHQKYSPGAAMAVGSAKPGTPTAMVCRGPSPGVDGRQNPRPRKGRTE